MKTTKIFTLVVFCMLLCFALCTVGVYAEGEAVSDFAFVVNGQAPAGEKLVLGENTVSATATVAAPVGSKLILVTVAYDRSSSPYRISDVSYKSVQVENASDTYTFGSVDADVTTKDILVNAMIWDGNMTSIMTPEPICKWDGRALLYTVSITDDEGTEHTALVNADTRTAVFYSNEPIAIADLSNVPAKIYRTRGVYTDQKGFETETLDLSSGQTTLSYPVASQMKTYDWTIKFDNGYSTFLTEDFTGSEMLDGESKRANSDTVYKDPKWSSTRKYLYTAGNTEGKDSFDLWTAGQWRLFEWVGNKITNERISNSAGAKPYGTDKPAFNLVMNIGSEAENDFLNLTQTGTVTDDSTEAQNEYLTWMIFKKTASGSPSIFNLPDKITKEITTMKIKLNPNGAVALGKLDQRTPSIQIGAVSLSPVLKPNGYYSLNTQVWNASTNQYETKSATLESDKWYTIETVQIDNGATVSYELYVDGNFICASEKAKGADNNDATTMLQGCFGASNKVPGYGIKLPVLRMNTFSLSMDDVKIMGIEAPAA